MSDPESGAGLPPESGASTPATVEGPPIGEPSGAKRPGHPFYLRGRHLRLPRSRAGLFALLLVLAAGGSVVAFTGVTMIQWTETADFCGRCHTMAPELEAYHLGSHRDVDCGECHVEPGVMGWVKSKLAGTRQLVGVVLNTYPTPIEPPDHQLLPSPADTCQKCHSLNDRSFVALRAQTQFQEDEANSRDFVGLMIRPAGGDAFDVKRSVHWHVLSQFTYTSPDANSAVIDYVTSTRDDGTVVEYIAQDRVTVAEDVRADIEALKATERNITLNCYDCHNRVGHDIQNPRTNLNYRLSTGVIDATLPYIMREGMRILWSSFPDAAAADAAIDELTTFYQRNYPQVYATKGAQIEVAKDELKVLYRLTATPAMNVTAATYASNIGHLDWPGLLPLPRRRASQGRQRRGDVGDHPVHVQHLSHLPADRAGRGQPAVGRTAEHPHRRRTLGVQPQERGRQPRSGWPIVWRMPRTRLLRELPLDRGRERGPRHDAHEPCRGHPHPGQPGLRVLPPARFLRSLSREPGAAGDDTQLARPRGGHRRGPAGRPLLATVARRLTPGAGTNPPRSPTPARPSPGPGGRRR